MVRQGQKEVTSMKTRRYELTDKEWKLIRPLIPIPHTGRPQKGYSRASQWHPVACPQWCALERSSGEIRSASDCVQLLLPLAG